MASAISAITAHITPGEWTKTTSAEENLVNFDKWIAKYERWEDICCRALNHDDTQRWNLLLSVGGSDLEDLIL